MKRHLLFETMLVRCDNQGHLAGEVQFKQKSRSLHFFLSSENSKLIVRLHSIEYAFFVDPIKALAKSELQTQHC